MNVLIKRRQLILATLVVALGAAVFVNWYYAGNNSTIQSPEETTGNEYVQNLGEAKYVNATGEEADYFSEVKLNRQKSRDEALDKLNKSLEKAKSGSEEANKITKNIDNLTAQIKLESDVEDDMLLFFETLQPVVSSNMTLVNLLQYSNAESLILVTLLGIVILVKLLQ